MTEKGVKLVAEHCLRLQELMLADCVSLDATAVEGLAGPAFENLVLLSVAGCYCVDDAALYSLAFGCPNVEELDVSRCHDLTNAGLMPVFRSEPMWLKLKRVRAQQLTNLSADAFRLPEHPQPPRSPRPPPVEAGECPGPQQHAYSRIEALDVAKCERLDDDAVLKIADLMGHCLVSISLAGCLNVSDTGVQVLTGNAPRLARADFSECYLLTDQACGYFRMCGDMESVDLSYCVSVTDAGITQLSEACSCLRHLGLAQCSSVTRRTVAALRAKSINVIW